MMFVSHHTSLVRAVLLFALACVAAAPTAAQLPKVCIGMVLDGPYERNEQGRSIFEREITELLGGEFDVSFPADKLVVADHTAEGVKAATDRLLADPEVDFLIALGPCPPTTSATGVSSPNLSSRRSSTTRRCREFR